MAEIQVLRDIRYGEHPLQTWDLYLPLAASEEVSSIRASGAIVFVHGGAWRRSIFLLLLSLTDFVCAAATNPSMKRSLEISRQHQDFQSQFQTIVYLQETHLWIQTYRSSILSMSRIHRWHWMQLSIPRSCIRSQTPSAYF